MIVLLILSIIDDDSDNRLNDSPESGLPMVVLVIGWMTVPADDTIPIIF